VVFLVYFVHLVEQNKSDEPDKGDRETSSVKKQGTAMETRDAVEPMIPWWAGGLGIGVGLIGVYLLDALGMANMKVKDLYLPGMVVAGLIFGVGFAVTGYCRGTALAAAAEGKPDAWTTVLGGLLGAVVFAFMFPDLETYLLSLGRYGPVTIHGSFGIQGLLLAAPLGALCLWLAAKLPAGGGA
jgi:hypothetical protein